MKLSTRISILEAQFSIDDLLFGVVTFKDGHSEKLPIHARDFDKEKSSIMKAIMWDKTGIDIKWINGNFEKQGMLPQILEYMAEKNKKESELL